MGNFRGVTFLRISITWIVRGKIFDSKPHPCPRASHVVYMSIRSKTFAVSQKPRKSYPVEITAIWYKLLEIPSCIYEDMFTIIIYEP